MLYIDPGGLPWRQLDRSGASLAVSSLSTRETPSAYTTASEAPEGWPVAPASRRDLGRNLNFVALAY